MTMPSRVVALPWPPKGLSPNDRRHRMAVAKLRKKYRADCAWSTIAAGVRSIRAAGLRVHITFHPPDARARDVDNMLASIKAGLDGVSDVIGIDDSRWTLVIARGAPAPRGRVDLVLESLAVNPEHSANGTPPVNPLPPRATLPPRAPWLPAGKRFEE